MDLSYLSDRDHAAVVNGLQSKSPRLPYGVAQGSVLGPIPFVSYAKPLEDSFDCQLVCHHSFADDICMINLALLTKLI